MDPLGSDSSGEIPRHQRRLEVLAVPAEPGTKTREKPCAILDLKL